MKEFDKYRTGTGALRKPDLFLFAGVLVAGAVFLIALLALQHTGNRVQVYVSGELKKEIPLSEEGCYDIQGADGGRNCFEIKDGRVWMKNASCPDGLCIHMGKIQNSGQSIICLPNQVVLQVTGNSLTNADEIDAVSGGPG